MALGVTTNNPGNLTVNGPNSFLYTGQTGVTFANNLYYAKFPDAQTGANALTEYLTSNIGTNNDTSLTTPTQLANYYLNGPNSNGGNLDAPVQGTAANPYGANWLNTVLQYAGLQPNSQIKSSDIPNIAKGIQAAEGNNALGGLAYNLPGQSTSDNVGGVASILPVSVTNLLGSGIQAEQDLSKSIKDTIQAAGQAIGIDIAGTGSNAGTTNSNANVKASQVNSSGVTSPSVVTDIISWLGNLFSINTGERLVAVIVGGGLILIAITILISGNKTAAIAA